MRKCTLEATTQELLSHIEALELVHSSDLLFTLDSSIFKRLILMLNALDLAFDFLFPGLTEVNLPLLVMVLELSDFFEFILFFDLEEGLLDRLC